MFVCVFCSVDPECERGGSGQPVCVLHHDQPEWRGTVQSDLLTYCPLWLDAPVFPVLIRVNRSPLLPPHAAPIQQAEELMRKIEKEEEQISYDDPEKKVFHLCIVNLVIGWVPAAVVFYRSGKSLPTMLLKTGALWVIFFNVSARKLHLLFWETNPRCSLFNYPNSMSGTRLSVMYCPSLYCWLYLFNSSCFYCEKKIYVAFTAPQENSCCFFGLCGWRDNLRTAFASYYYYLYVLFKPFEIVKMMSDPTV